MPPPEPPRPPTVYRRHLALNIALMVCTLGLWVPVWVFVWWTVDARNHAEQDRYRREWVAYQQALAVWRWRSSMLVAAPFVGPGPGLGWAAQQGEQARERA